MNRQSLGRKQSISSDLRKYGILKLCDLFLDTALLAIRERIYKPRFTQYGLVEALFFPKSIDYYTRYFDVTDTLLNYVSTNACVLDLGAGERGGISFFLRQNAFSLVLLDRKRFRPKPWVRDVIVGDGTMLPFKNNCFDIVVSVATLEHLPADVRINLLSELKRISKTIILHFPCDDKVGKFLGRKSDHAFQEFHEKTFGYKDEKTAEHIASVHPVVEEIGALLPGSQIIGRKNCNIWLRYMVFSPKPIIGFLAGLVYLLSWKKGDNKPPYYECMITYEKSQAKFSVTHDDLLGVSH